MIYRVMKTASFDMTAQTFGKWSGVRVFSMLQDRIEFTLFYQRQQLQRLSAAMVKEAGHYASLAVLSAHPGFTAVSGGITSPFWTWFDEPLNLNQPIRAWFSAPFHLRIQGCEAAFRRVADTNLSADAVPTVAPTFATPMPSLDDGGCSTFEDLAAALTQLAQETADGNLPVPTNATQPTAPDTAIATGYAEDFLQRATTWRLYSGRGEDELRDSARQMIRWVMRNLRLNMSPPVIPWPSRSLVWTLLTNKFQGILSTSQRAKWVVRRLRRTLPRWLYSVPIRRSPPHLETLLPLPRHGWVVHSSTCPSTTGCSVT